MTQSLPPSSSSPSPTELDTAVVLPAALETGGISSPDVPSVSPPMTHEEAKLAVLASRLDRFGIPYAEALEDVDVEAIITRYLEARGAVLSDADLPQSPWLASDWAIDRIAALEAALTPSTETKGAYIGEFIFPRTYTDEYGDEITVNVNVPWTTIKEIMKAISKFAEEK